MRALTEYLALAGSFVSAAGINDRIVAPRNFRTVLTACGLALRNRASAAL